MNLDLSDEDSDENSLQSIHSLNPIHQDDEENIRRTPSSLNNYTILPPIKSATGDNQFLKQLQEKYHQPTGESPEIENHAKLDDAYLKMKRLDKALEEAFEKEKQVKIETMSLMKKYIFILIHSFKIDDVFKTSLKFDLYLFKFNSTYMII